MAPKKGMFVGTASAPSINRPQTRRRVMVVLPKSWSINDLQELKDELEQSMSVTTFREDDELEMAHIQAVLGQHNLFILVLGEHPVSWCNMNQLRLERMAENAGVECMVLQSTNIEHIVSIAA
jgi:hypothetical protein